MRKRLAFENRMDWKALADRYGDRIFLVARSILGDDALARDVAQETLLKPAAKGRLAAVRLRYREPGTREVLETQASVGRGQVDDRSPSFRLASAVAQFAEILRESPHAKGITLAQVLAEAEAALAALDKPADVAEFVELVTIALQRKK